MTYRWQAIWPPIRKSLVRICVKLKYSLRASFTNSGVRFKTKYWEDFIFYILTSSSIRSLWLNLSALRFQQCATFKYLITFQDGTPPHYCIKVRRLLYTTINDWSLDHLSWHQDHQIWSIWIYFYDTI